MHVVATAGHVDHGKSTLVRALTGTDPDRLAEERRRGLTIDLGYAWTTLADGQHLAFVDVPGHERFIATTLAGLGAVPAVLFVVAADEGWREQSSEHLAAADALGLRHGLLAVTRSDLADPMRAIAESLDQISRSSLGAVPHVAVSGVTGDGLPELRDALATLVADLPAPDRDARVRLWVDRSFTIRGSGTVVTGTLGAGTVAVGDELVLGERRVAVRGVQSLGTARERVAAVARVALNLRGVGADEIGRGDVLLTPTPWMRTDLVDVAVPDAAHLPAHPVLHVGTAAVPVHVRPLGAASARLALATPLPLLPGDRGVLRDPGRHAVVGGIEVLDADPPPFTRRGDARARAVTLASGRPSPLAEVERRGAVRAVHLQALGIPVSEEARRCAGWVVAPAVWAGWVSDVEAVADRWLASRPLEPGIPLGALRHELRVPDDAVLDAVLDAAGLTARDGRVGSRRESLGAAEDSVRTVERTLAADPFAAPDRAELGRLRLGARELAAAQRAGRLLVLPGDVVLLASAPDTAIARLRDLEPPFTASAARVALGTSRRVALPLLEHLDRLGRTERADELGRRSVLG